MQIKKINYILGILILIFYISILSKYIEKQSTYRKGFVVSEYETPLYSFILNIGIKYKNEICSKGYNICKFKNDNINIQKNYIFKNNNINKIFNCNLNSPNIILVYVEGLSSIVLNYKTESYGALMPNIKKLEDKSISFGNYFNHTAATYRGIKGQHFSGYPEIGGSIEGRGWEQKDNAKILNKYYNKSIIDILNKRGYSSKFYVPLPNQHPFNYLLKNIGYQEVINANILSESVSRKIDLNNIDNFLNDDEFFYAIIENLKGKNQPLPYIVAMYNTGTHAFLDSPNSGRKYGSGNNQVLNRFYNFDYEFGKFYNKLLSDGYLKNTILIVTSDHSTLPDKPYKEIFQNGARFFVDKIPLIINTPCNKSKKIDAAGRTSLDFAPTILSLLGINDEINSFLGRSLFDRDGDSELNFAAIGNEYYFIKDNFVYHESEIAPELIDAFSRKKQFVENYYFLERKNKLYIGEK